MKVLLILISIVGLASSAWAHDIIQMAYNPQNRILTVTVAYEGGLKAHNWSADFDPCITDTRPHQLAIRLEDSGWDDTGTKGTLQNVPVDLNVAAQCLPAEVTIFVGRHHRTVLIN